MVRVRLGIGVYYGSFLYGGLDLAIVEDRKWKSAPKVVLPKAEIVNGWARNPRYDARRDGDVAGGELTRGADDLVRRLASMGGSRRVRRGAVPGLADHRRTGRQRPSARDVRARPDDAHGLANPAVQVLDQASGEIVYTLRIAVSAFTPTVFKEGVYTVKVSEPDSGVEFVHADQRARRPK